MEDRRGKCTENEADWFTFPGNRCCPIGEGHAGETGAEDTKVKRGNRENGNNKGRRRARQPLNVEIERMEIIKAGGEPVSLYYLT